MLPIHTILHATDFSERSAAALQVACALARDYDARLVILHVIPRPVLAFGEGVVPPDPELLYDEARQRLARLAVTDTNLAVARRVEEGDAATVILYEAETLPADLIVLGTHGRTGLRRLLMGSVAEEVSRHAPCPVLTVSTTPRFAEQPAPLVPEAMGVAGPMEIN